MFTLLYSFILLVLKPWLTSNLKELSFPLFPLLVVIITTPFAALLPYKDVDAASFKTVRLSISLEFILEKLPVYSTPSTIINGLLDADIDPIPLILIAGLEPGWPLAGESFTPAEAPSKALKTLVNGLFSIVAALICVADPVKAVFFAVP